MQKLKKIYETGLTTNAHNDINYNFEILKKSYKKMELVLNDLGISGEYVMITFEEFNYKYDENGNEINQKINRYTQVLKSKEITYYSTNPLTLKITEPNSISGNISFDMPKGTVNISTTSTPNNKDVSFEPKEVNASYNISLKNGENNIIKGSIGGLTDDGDDNHKGKVAISLPYFELTYELNEKKENTILLNEVDVKKYNGISLPKPKNELFEFGFYEIRTDGYGMLFKINNKEIFEKPIFIIEKEKHGSQGYTYEIHSIITPKLKIINDSDSDEYNDYEIIWENIDFKKYYVKKIQIF